MDAKRKVNCGVGFVFIIFLSIVAMGTEAPGDTINLTGIPTGDYRWRDVADQLYSGSYRTSYSYTQDDTVTVKITYDAVGTTLSGTLEATNLKPNFAYQLKLEGLQGNPANELIGLAGRWWQEEWDGSKWANGKNLNDKGDGSSPNPNDTIYLQRCQIVDTTSPTGLKYRYTGYLVLDYFITDENGDAVLDFETNSSYHVLWKTSQRLATPSDGPEKSRSFAPDQSSPAYDTDYPSQTVHIYGEWERLPIGGVYLQVGDYSAQIILTEESFHGSGGTYAGNWAAAMDGQINFSIIPGDEPTAITLASFEAIPGNHTVELIWATGDETDNLGFNLYRAASENGEYEKINSYLILSEVGSGLGTTYEFVDGSLKNRKMYYYKLEDVNVNGVKTMHGPVRARPRLMYEFLK